MKENINAIQVAELHARYVKKALKGTPDHLRDECAVALGAEANRQAKAMGLYEEDLTPAITALLGRIRYQELITTLKTKQDTAVAELIRSAEVILPSAGYVVKYVIKGLAALDDELRASFSPVSATCSHHCPCQAAAGCDSPGQG